MTRCAHEPSYAASVAGSIGSTIEASHSRLVDAGRNGRHPHRLSGKGRIRSRGSALSQPTGVIGRCENDGHSVMDVRD